MVSKRRRISRGFFCGELILHPTLACGGPLSGCCEVIFARETARYTRRWIALLRRVMNKGKVVAMGQKQELTAEAVGEVSLERALLDAEVANRRVIELTRGLLEREARIAKLQIEIVALKQMLDPRRKMEHVFRKNHALYVVARRARKMMGQ